MNFLNLIPERTLGTEEASGKRLRTGAAESAARNAEQKGAFPQYVQQAADENPAFRQSSAERDEQSARAVQRQKSGKTAAAKADGANQDAKEVAGDLNEKDKAPANAAAVDSLAALMALASTPQAVDGETEKAAVGLTGPANAVLGGSNPTAENLASPAPAEDVPLGTETADISTVLAGLVVTGKERHLAPVGAKPVQNMGEVDAKLALAAESGQAAVSAQDAKSAQAVKSGLDMNGAGGAAVRATMTDGETAPEVDSGKALKSDEPAAIVDASASSPSSGQGFQEGGGQNQNLAGNAAALGLNSSSHSASGTAPSPSEQIASKLSELLASAASGLGADGQEATTGTPVQVLRIQLQPAELGEVTVRLTLKQNVLELQIDAAHRDTARLVEKDREMLSGMLHAAGFAVDGVTIRLGGVDGAAAQSADTPGGASSGSQAHSQSGSSQQERRNSGEGRQGGAANERFSGNGGNNADKGRDRALAGGGGVYV